MSYRVQNTLTDVIEGVFTSNYALPVTVAAFVKFDGGVHPLSSDAFLQLGTTASTNASSVMVRTIATDDTFRLLSFDSGGASSNCDEVVNVDGVWFAIVGVITGDSLRDLYVLDTTHTNQSTGTRAVGSALNRVRCGAALDDTFVASAYFAELAIWNVALSVSDLDNYMGGVRATSIQPSNLIGYWPLNAANATQANEGVDAGGDLSVNGADFAADHPTITDPPSSAPTLFVVASPLRLA